jgi:ligand-binding sensor domain-containing protein
VKISKQFRINTLSIFLTTILGMSSLFGQSAMGEWTLHVPNKQAIGVVSHKNMVYTAFLTGVLAYDKDAKEKSMLTYVNSLSDVSISNIGIDPSTGTVVVGYVNGNIDFLTENRTDNLPFIKLAQIQGVKTIQQIVARNGKLYIATGFGIVVIDPKKKEVKDTYYPTLNNEGIWDVAFSGDTIFALTKTKLLYANVNSPALGSATNWTTDTRVPLNLNETYKDLEIIDSKLILSKNVDSFGMDSIFVVGSSGLTTIPYQPFGYQLKSMTTIDNKLTINLEGGVFIYNENLDGFDFAYNTYSPGVFVNSNGSYKQDGNLYIADNEFGLVKVSSDFGHEKISFEGPPKNDFYNMDWKDGKLAVAAGGLSGTYFTFNNSGVYTLEDGKWDWYAYQNVPGMDTIEFFDAIAVSINPKNPDEVAIASYSGAPLNIVNKDRVLVGQYNADNSPLQKTVLNNGYTMVSDVEYDDDGNLWMINSYASQTLKVLKANKEWVSFDLGTNSKNNITGDLLIDNYDNLWLVVEGKGLFAYDYNETIDNPADDRVQNFVKSSLTENLPSNSIRAIAVDFDDEIWIGTDNGFAIIYNSDNVFESTQPEFLPQRIKLEFEGNVEYLLGSTAINDIEIDGGNRKWLSTEGSGVFLLSPDGQTILANYTTENSNLISNNAYEMEIDDKTGEVYVTTEEGLVSLRTDASFEDPNYSDVRVFPNPVRPEFEGLITIQGIKYNSDVKFTDMAGNLVYKTISNGGTAVWNGRNLDGQKVASGVYLIWTAPDDRERKGRKVGKVVIIND